MIISPVNPRSLPVIPALSDEEISLLYNNRLAVPDYPAYLARWQAASEALRQRTRYHADLRYGLAPRNRIDLFPANADVLDGGRQPLLIFFHGGYWQYLDKHDWSCIAAPFMARGMAVAVVGYTLCPETTVAGIVDEARAACAFLYLHADDYEVDRNRLHVAGHSAGGHLTAMMLATDWPAQDARLPKQPFASGIAISGVFDLEPLTLTPLNDALRLNRAEALAVSPIFRRPVKQAPLLTVVGGAETAEFLRQSREFSAAWPEADYVEAAGFNHFSIIDAFHAPEGPVFAAAWRHTNRAGGPPGA